MAKKKTIEPQQLESPAKHTVMYYQVQEHIPEEGRYIIGYSEITGSYHLCRHSMLLGWRDVKGIELKCITHWLDMHIPMPFAITNQIDEKAANKYGIIVSHTIYGVSFN